ncbi:MAG: ArsB/NhaD family transporter [Pseudomonadota bacterium]
MQATEATVLFGLDPLGVSAGIFVMAYGFLLSERIHRTVVALLGAAAMLLSGVLTQDQAIAGIDFNTIALLAGMMVIIAITRRTGVFEFIAIWAAKRARAEPIGILILLALVTAVFSAFLDNLTTVLLVVPVALLIVDKLKVSPYPFLFSQILAANIGGTATLIGDPPNILIGSATHLSFNDFLLQLGPIALFLLGLVLLVFYGIWGRSLHTTPELKERVMRFDARGSLRDMRLLRQSLLVLGLVILGFIIGEHFAIAPGTTAMSGAALLLLLNGIGEDRRGQAEQVRVALEEVEWSALFFFIGLFVIVHGVQSTGLLERLAAGLMDVTGGDPMVTAFTTLWLSAAVSAVIDNIPFVATMIPLVHSMEAGLGGMAAAEPVWWSLALGACLGGNGTLVGAAANVMVAGLAERAGTPISFLRFLLIGMPLMIASVALANVYLYLRHFL